MAPFHIGTRRLSFRRMSAGSLASGVSTWAVQPAYCFFQWAARRA